MKTNTVSFYTPMGVVNVEHLGHGSLHLEWEDMHIYVDPYSDVYDFSQCRKADLILLTHAHTDHYDTKAIEQVAQPHTTFIVSKGVSTCIENNLLGMFGNQERNPSEDKKMDLDNNDLNVDPSTNLVNMLIIPKLRHCSIITLRNGESVICSGIKISAVPAYNIERKRDNGKPFHLKGEGNGYILDMQGFEFYIAGDTEIIPEMDQLKPETQRFQGGLDVAFLPKNLPYTLSDDEFIKLANMIRPKNLFPIHYFDIDIEKLREGIDTGICLYVDGNQVN